jgi:hypothetical protein
MVLGVGVRLWLPYLNLAIGSSALAFQTAVLYPWHYELDAAFKEQQKTLEMLTAAAAAAVTTTGAGRPSTIESTLSEWERSIQEFSMLAVC